MSDFNRKMNETGARVNKTVSDAAERLEKESTELIDYLNREVVPAVRDRSSKALRIAAGKLQELAEFMDKHKASSQEKKTE
jgi:50S ribosomal subunit-associated GTPase HflX